MYKESRGELINKCKQLGLINEKCEEYLNAPRLKQANKAYFEEFCKSEGGYFALLLSDDEICDNKELVIIAKKYGFNSGYHLLSSRLLNDPELALVLANCEKYEYTKISKKLRDDVDLMLEAIKVNPNIYCSLPVKVKVDRRIVLEVAKNAPNHLRLLDEVRKEYREKYKNDFEVAMCVASSYRPDCLQFFSEEILSDRRIIERAFCPTNKEIFSMRIINNTWALKYIDKSFWVDDKSLVESILQQDGLILEFLPGCYKSDKKYVLIAVNNNPEAIEFCDEKFCDDEEVIMAALQEDSETILSCASKRICSIYDIVYKAVTVDALNLEFASNELKDNEHIVRRALKTYGGAIEYASERLQQNKDMIDISRNNM